MIVGSIVTIVLAVVGWIVTSEPQDPAGAEQVSSPGAVQAESDAQVQSGSPGAVQAEIQADSGAQVQTGSPGAIQAGGDVNQSITIKDDPEVREMVAEVLRRTSRPLQELLKERYTLGYLMFYCDLKEKHVYPVGEPNSSEYINWDSVKMSWTETSLDIKVGEMQLGTIGPVAFYLFGFAPGPRMAAFTRNRKLGIEYRLTLEILDEDAPPGALGVIGASRISLDEPVPSAPQPTPAPLN